MVPNVSGGVNASYKLNWGGEATDYKIGWLIRILSIWRITARYKKKLLIAFPSFYLVERGFSTVTNPLTRKKRRKKYNSYK